MIRLSKRLTAVAGLVTGRPVLADIGTDHGYIPVYLAIEGRIPRAIAMDVNEGPLMRAEEHIRQYGLEQVIETRRSDGLRALRPGEAQTIVIAGMGGALMRRILTEGRETAEKAGELILQPQSELREFREFLWDSGYRVEAEDMVLEDGKYYPMMRAVHQNSWNRGNGSPLESGENEKEPEGQRPERLVFQYGEKLLENRHPVLKQYLELQRKQKEQIWNHLTRYARGNQEERKRVLGLELADISRALELFQ